MVSIILTFIIAIALITIGTIKLLSLKKIESKGIKTIGKIVDLKKSSSSDSLIYYPVVAFILRDESEITKQSPVSIIPGTYKIGSQVKIIYDPANLEIFYINEWQTYAILSGLIFLGFAFFLSGLLIIL